MVICLFCKREFKQLSNTHLKKCANITQKEYKTLFPSSDITSIETSEKNSKAKTGIKQDPEWVRKRFENNSGHKGHHHTVEAKKKISKALQGRNPWNSMEDPEEAKRNLSKVKRGKLLSREHKENLKKSFTKERRELHSLIQKKHFQDENFIKKFVQGSKVSPNKTELMLIELLSQLNLKYEYVGNYKIWIEGRNPDFIDKDAKKIIEFFGYRHREEFTKEPNSAHEDKRVKHYQKYGYNCLVLWDEDLTNKETLSQKILSF